MVCRTASALVRLRPLGVREVMSSARAVISWMLLVAMLASLPVAASGRFICELGMKEAGPDCPLCHGRSGADQSSPSVGNGCCKFVTVWSAAESNPAIASVEKPVVAPSPLLPADAGHSLFVAPDRTPIAFASNIGLPRTSSSSYLSDFLRL